MKFFYSGMFGAPVLNNSAGSLISLLDSCLVTGWGTKTATSTNISSGVCTIVYTGGSGAEVGTTINVSGATPVVLNGDQIVTAIGVNSVSFATTAANQTATGTITFKMASLGFVKSFTGTNLAAYKSTALLSTQLFLRVNDTAAKFARVVGFETMTAISTGTGNFPTAAQVSGGLYWPKSDGVDALSRKWYLFGDESAFYLCLNPSNSTSPTTPSSPFNSMVFFFGDINSKKSADGFRCVISGHRYDQDDGNSGYPQRTDAGSIRGFGCLAVSDRDRNQFSTYIARSHSALGTSKEVWRIGAGNIGQNGNAYSGTDEVVTTGAYGQLPTFPNPADGGIIGCNLMAISDGAIRGDFPGMLHIVNDQASATLTSNDRVIPTGALSSRKYFVVQAAPSNVAWAKGAVLFDIVGPWR
jgi:hypothetical protein